MSAHDTWQAANRRHLAAEVERVRALVERHLGRDADVDAAGAAARRTARPDTALETLSDTLGLSSFERDVLVLCAAVELSGSFPALLAQAQGDPQRAYPTFALALATLPEPHWSALAPDGALRRWRLVEVGPGAALTQSPLRIDERVLHHLAGVRHLDARLAAVVEPVPAPGELAPSHQAVAERMAATWAHAAQADDELPALQLHGADPAALREVAAAACAELGLELHALAAHAVPAAGPELETLLRVWEREAAMGGLVLLLELEAGEPDAAREAALSRLVDGTRAPLLLAGREPRAARLRPLVNFQVRRPPRGERAALWRAALGEHAEGLNGAVDQLVEQFAIGVPGVRAACAAALGSADDDEDDAEALGAALWDACRTQARARLEELAQRIETTAGWDDLVLPDGQKALLRDVAAQVRARPTVYGRWGWGAQGARGMGITALFAGESGTGKTMAAEVIARELRLDLFRIDLSGVVSKYIGETEKNLRRVFDAAEEAGAVLLFDEADALFGKRSEVNDSHDRHANIEVAYLLQRMEAYPGLAVLTTNLRDALDTAFLRRIRFIVQFPYPDAAQREQIWRRVFPPGVPTDGLRWGELARLNVAGGNIRNVALNAAFFAAAEDAPVRMPHLLRAARAEYDKLQRPLTAAEVGGWE